MAGVFRLPTDDETSLKEELVGRVISIFWDGDSSYYPCEVLAFKGESNTYVVKYYGSDNEISDEKLTESVWLIWSGSKVDYVSQFGKKEVNNEVILLSIS